MEALGHVANVPSAQLLEAALRRIVDASDRFVKDTGLKHGDLLTDAVDAARPLIARKETP